MADLNTPLEDPEALARWAGFDWAPACAGELVVGECDR